MSLSSHHPIPDHTNTYAAMPSVTLCDPMDCSPPGSSAKGFSRQESWSGSPCPPPGDLPDPGIKPGSPVSPALQTDSLLLSHQGSLGIGMGLLQLGLLIFEKYQINSII